MIEDSLVIYRLSRAPERRIFYIDVGNLPKVKQNNICVMSCLAIVISWFTMPTLVRFVTTKNDVHDGGLLVASS